MQVDDALLTILWNAGDEVLDQHRVTLPAGLPPDHYWVAVGIYDLETVERLPAFSARGVHY